MRKPAGNLVVRPLRPAGHTSRRQAPRAVSCTPCSCNVTLRRRRRHRPDPPVAAAADGRHRTPPTTTISRAPARPTINMALPSPPPPPSARLARVRRRRFLTYCTTRDRSHRPIFAVWITIFIRKKIRSNIITIDIIIIITIIIIWYRTEFLYENPFGLFIKFSILKYRIRSLFLPFFSLFIFVLARTTSIHPV